MNDSPVRYRGMCRRCSWGTREFVKYSSAEDAAKDHTKVTSHTTHVVDQFGHVAGSTIRPEQRQS